MNASKLDQLMTFWRLKGSISEPIYKGINIEHQKRFRVSERYLNTKNVQVKIIFYESTDLWGDPIYDLRYIDVTSKHINLSEMYFGQEAIAYIETLE